VYYVLGVCYKCLTIKITHAYAKKMSIVSVQYPVSGLPASVLPVMGFQDGISGFMFPCSLASPKKWFHAFTIFDFLGRVCVLSESISF
jgi:hypothetical protein